MSNNVSGKQSLFDGEFQRALVLFLLSCMSFVAVYAFLAPGFFTIKAPVHADIYRYYDFAQRNDLWLSILKMPRPLMLIFLKIVPTVTFSAFHASLLLPGVILPIALLLTAERIIAFRATYLSAVGYFALCFALPSFYELQPLDYGGALSGIFACLAALSLASARLGSTWSIVMFISLSLVSIETKPTFAAFLVLVPWALILRTGTRTSMLCSAAALAVGLGVFLLDKWLGSPFVGVGSSKGSSYQILGTVGAVAEAGIYYVTKLLSPMTWILVAFSAMQVLMRSRYQILIAIFLLALSTLVPVLLIPNHRFVMYAWFPSSIILLTVPVALSTSRVKFTQIVRVISLGAIVASLVGESKFLSSYRNWNEYNQKQNLAVMQSMSYIANQLRPGNRVLISGKFNPFTPYKNDKLISGVFPPGVDWRVSAAPADDPLIAVSPDTSKFVTLKNYGQEDFDLHVAYDDKGNVAYVGEMDERLKNLDGDVATKIGLLLCRTTANGGVNVDSACIKSTQR